MLCLKCSHILDASYLPDLTKFIDVLEKGEYWFESIQDIPDDYLIFTLEATSSEFFDGISQSCFVCTTLWQCISGEDREKCRELEKTQILIKYGIELGQDENTLLPHLSINVEFAEKNLSTRWGGSQTFSIEAWSGELTVVSIGKNALTYYCKRSDTAPLSVRRHSVGTQLV